MRFEFELQKKHFLPLSTLLLLLIFLVFFSSSLPEVNTNQAYHYIQQIALGPNDGNANENVSIDSDGDGTIDYVENADMLDGLHATDIASQWADSGVDPNDIFFNRGDVGIGTTAPKARLDVNGGIKVGYDSGTCNSDKAGTLRYTSGVIELCDGSAWGELTSEVQAPDPCEADFQSCKGIKDAGCSSGNGVYTLHLNGYDIQTYCDMSTYGGGWTLVFNNKGTDISLWNSMTKNKLQTQYRDCTSLGSNCYLALNTWNTILDDGEHRRMDKWTKTDGTTWAHYLTPIDGFRLDGNLNHNSLTTWAQNQMILIAESTQYSEDTVKQLGYQMYTRSDVHIYTPDEVNGLGEMYDSYRFGGGGWYTRWVLTSDYTSMYGYACRQYSKGCFYNNDAAGSYLEIWLR